MILTTGAVAGVQYFLMDASKRYDPRNGADVLACAASLDYVLLFASERASEIADDDASVTKNVRDLLTHACAVGLDIVDEIATGPTSRLDDFVERHLRPGGFFDVLRSLRESGAVSSDDVTFRTLTTADTLLERRRRKK